MRKERKATGKEGRGAITKFKLKGSNVKVTRLPREQTQMKGRKGKEGKEGMDEEGEESDREGGGKGQGSIQTLFFPTSSADYAAVSV